MNGAERRRACRLPLHVPVQLDGPGGPIDAEMQDVSRTGIRLHVRTLALGFTPTLDLGSTAAMVAERLETTVGLRLHHQRLGSLVSHRARIMRVALPPDAPDSVELGCAFETPLTTEETTMLGAPMPPIEGSDEAFCPRADAPAPFRRAPPRPSPVPAEPDRPHPEHDEPKARVPAFVTTSRRTYRAYLQGAEEDSQGALVGHADQVSREALRVRVSREGYEGDSAAEATVRFTSRHGTHLRLKLMDGHRHVWTGGVRVCGLEVPPQRAEDLYVTLAFERRLRPAERRRLGLTTDVA